MASGPNWKIYIINLERAVIRKQFMLRQLNKLNITNYEFIPALDGAQKGEQWLQDQIDHKNLVRPLRGSEIACTLSHKMTLEHFLEEDNIEFAIMLEDDVLLPDNFIEVIENTVKHMTGDDVVLLSWSLHTAQRFRKKAAIDKKTDLIQAVKPIEQVYTTAAYIMPKPVAKRHINTIYPITDVADSWWYYKGKGSMKEILLAYPYPIRQEIFQSTRGSKAKLYQLINWVIYHKVPGLYQFLTERRTREERRRLLNVELVNE